MRFEGETILVFERLGNAWIKAHARFNPRSGARLLHHRSRCWRLKADPLPQRNPPRGNRIAVFAMIELRTVVLADAVGRCRGRDSNSHGSLLSRILNASFDTQI